MIELLLEAESALSLGLLDRAEILYRQVAGADPRNSIAVVGLARVMLERGDEPGALKHARRALAIDPENIAAQRMVQRLEEVLAYRGAGATTPRAPGARIGPAPAPDAALSPGSAQPHDATSSDALSSRSASAPASAPVSVSASAAASVSAPVSAIPALPPVAGDRETRPAAESEGPPPAASPGSRSFIDRLLRRR